jgi:hypothetical protein
MSTRRGWQAIVGELEAVLRHLDVAQGVDAQMCDGQLWIRHTPTQPWVAPYVAAAPQGVPPVTAYAASRWRSSVLRSPHAPPRERNEEV